jgi:hypothetical protein
MTAGLKLPLIPEKKTGMTEWHFRLCGKGLRLRAVLRCPRGQTMNLRARSVKKLKRPSNAGMKTA